MAPLECILVLIVTKLVGADVYSNIQAGAGYSSDKQQIVPQRCYNATPSSISEQEGFAQLGAAQSSSELEKELGISVSATFSFGMFSTEAKANYLKSVEEKDYSISLNYYQYARNKVTVQLLGHGEKALIESFREFYDGGKNQYFGLMCGDYYIGSYRQGALLTMGLKIEFSSSNAKTEFMAQVGATFGDIVSAAAKVNSVVTEHKIKGSVTIHAFQMGGEPSQLSNILSSSDSSEYFALACSLTSMDKCIKAAGGLLDYAKYKFANQFSTVNNTGLTPLGIAFTELIPIKYAGLNPPPSLVTPEVKQYRNELISKLMEIEYYQEKLHPFLNKAYPIELDDDFLKKASSVLSKADKNLNILMQAHGGGADCFNFPDDCKSVKAVLDSHLHNITTDDLKFLEPIKYTLTFKGGMLYLGTNGSWEAVPNNKPGKESLAEFHNAFLSEKYYSYLSSIKYPESKTIFTYFYHGTPTVISPDGTVTYSGVLGKKESGQTLGMLIESEDHEEYKRKSPFFFDVFNITELSHNY